MQILNEKYCFGPNSKVLKDVMSQSNYLLVTQKKSKSKSRNKQPDILETYLEKIETMK